MNVKTMTLDGEEYVLVPRAEYLRMTEGTVDAVEYVRASLGRDLKTAREHAGLTQADLAKKLKKAQATVSSSESGRISVSAAYVAKVLKVCGLPSDWKRPQ